MEMGKPLKESLGEVTKTVRFLNFFAENTQKYMEATKINDTGDKDVRIVYEPIGVIAAIKPWNIPLQTPIWGIAPALMAGCVNCIARC